METTTERFTTWFNSVSRDSVSVPAGDECLPENALTVVEAMGPTGYYMAIVKVCPDVRSYNVDIKGPRDFWKVIVRKRRGGINGRVRRWYNGRTEAHI